MPLLRGSPGRAGQGAGGWVRRVVRRLAAATGAAARMAGAGAGQGSPAAAGQPGAAAPGDGPRMMTRGWRDWAGLPEHLLMKVAGKAVAQTEAGWAAHLKERAPAPWYWTGTGRYWTEERIQEVMAARKREGNCLFVFARVCKAWRKAQLKVGGPLRTRVPSDVIVPGSVALVKWALAEGCPRTYKSDIMASSTVFDLAARDGQVELVKWLCGEGGFTMNWIVMSEAARSGNLKLVQWLRGEGCLWCWKTCYEAVDNGHVEVLRWAREIGAPWYASTRDRAAAELGYTDDFGNLWEYSDDE